MTCIKNIYGGVFLCSETKQDVDGMEEVKSLFIRVAMCAAGHLSPMCALLGGILGQEILKACSGKFTPIKQWFYYHCVDALPDAPLPMEEVAPKQCRYDGQIMVQYILSIFTPRYVHHAPIVEHSNA